MTWSTEKKEGPALLPSGEADSGYVHERLREYNARYMRDTGDFSFHVEEEGRIVGGIVAGGLGDLLEVEFLYVEEAYRGRGLGQRLLAHVEDLARKKGLKRVLLNTYSFQAPGFYEKLGYTQVLKLAPAFDDVTQTYFLKEL